MLETFTLGEQGIVRKDAEICAVGQVERLTE
jgi:hypothetical protein